MNTKVFINRTLNLKRIHYLGFDMDHTLIRYHSEKFEKLSHSIMVEKLIKEKGYPESIRKHPFNYNLAVRGLVVDKKRGNLIKVNRHGAIRLSYHGTHPLDYKTQQKLYKSTYLDLGEPNFIAIDTAFSISLATLFMQLIENKNTDTTNKYPDFSIITEDVIWALDEAHRDGSLKSVVKEHLDEFIIKDPRVVAGLERFKKHGKKLFVLTNSDFHYTKLLMDFAINPFLKDHKTWNELFDVVITNAQKPRFFYDNLKFLKVNPENGSMTNCNEKLKSGIYQGGCASIFTKDLSLEGDEILYIGDHIYGDILRLKKDCNWRTAMVIEELEQELQNNNKAIPISSEIDSLMKKKEPMEETLTELVTKKIEKSESVSEDQLASLQKQISDIDTQISQLIKKQTHIYNSLWGPLMRAGNEESYFAYQVDRYACVYMPCLADLFEHSPRTYFRAQRRPLAHEI